MFTMLKSLRAALMDRLKWLVAGDELAILDRYREACDQSHIWDRSSYETQAMVKWIGRHAEGMRTPTGRALHISLGQKTMDLYRTPMPIAAADTNQA